MEPYFLELFFNPSAAYLPANRVRQDYEAAKGQIANFVGAKASDLIITGSATEANALAFTVVLPFFERGRNFRKKPNSTPVKMPKILVLETEHASVLRNAEKYGSKTIKVDQTGLINLKDLRSKITDETVLISVSLASNELGTIQPLAEIAELVRTERQARLARGVATPL